MENENIQPGGLGPEKRPKDELSEVRRVSQEALTQFRALFRTSLEKLKELGVKEGLLDPNTPLDQVRPKIIESIKELNERRAKRRQQEREAKDRRQP